MQKNSKNVCLVFGTCKTFSVKYVYLLTLKSIITY